MSLVTSLAPIVGCGGSSDPAAQRETAPPSPEKASVEPAATEVVSQFLDRVRRGGNDSTADQLLTKLARQEMKRIGRPLQFPGSPETTYEVRKAMPIPNEPDSVWVQTYLSEPSDEGASLQYEVVWTLRQENEQWRISGFVLDQGDQLEPLRIDFENGDEMEARLAAVEQAAEAEAEPAPLER
jgi:hypothetical protein